MSALTDPLSQLESAVTDLETRVKLKIEDAEKKDVPTPEEMAKLTALVDKVKNIAL